MMYLISREAVGGEKIDRYWRPLSHNALRVYFLITGRGFESLFASFH